MAKRPITPEERARWAEARRVLVARIEREEQRVRLRRAQRERRQRQLQRLTFGLLGR